MVLLFEESIIQKFVWVSLCEAQDVVGHDVLVTTNVGRINSLGRNHREHAKKAAQQNKWMVPVLSALLKMTG